MAKIIIEDKDSSKEYVLEFDRASVLEADKRGLTPKDDAELSSTVNLFRGALIKHQPKMTDEEALDLFCKIKNKAGLLTKLATMWKEPVESLIGSSSEKKGNVSWEEK